MKNFELSQSGDSIGCWLRKSSLLLLLPFLLAISASVAAQEKSSDEWQYDFEVYGWLPTFAVNPANGSEVKLHLKDILKNLDMLAMFDFGARKDKVSFNTDFIWMNLGAKDVISGEIINRPENFEAKIDLRGVISTVDAGYQIAGDDMHRLDLVGGVRYLYLKLGLEVDLNELSEKKYLGGHNWDGIVGLRGKKTLNDKWYLDYYGDIGAGDSDLTWQTRLGFGYQFDKFTGTFGFRYLRFDLDKKKSELDNLYVIGPYIGAKWLF